MKSTTKTREWLKRYIPAEILGTITSLVGAVLAYHSTHSYIAGAASGWVGEGIGFYGYFITIELLLNAKRYQEQRLVKRIWSVIAKASTNLLVEFVPAEILDNFIIRPFLMYEVPQHIHPYAIGFLIAKFGADIVFYIFAIVGYETRRKWLT